MVRKQNRGRITKVVLENVRISVNVDLLKEDAGGGGSGSINGSSESSWTKERGLAGITGRTNSSRTPKQIVGGQTLNLFSRVNGKVYAPSQQPHINLRNGWKIAE